MTPFVTRVAPSPTGMFHIGTARAALYSWLAARATGGKFILRIDDTDAERSTDEAYDVIMESMKWLGLDHDEGYVQSDRMVLYKREINRLVADGLAYREDGAVKLRMPNPMPRTWEDHITGTVKISDHDLKMIDGLVIARSDGSPTYHFASVFDDVDMGVNFIIRGMDHLNNAPKHVAIYRALGTIEPDFAHVGLIEIMKDGKRQKLSKRDGAASLLNYRDEGYEPEAILDYLMRVGWSHGAADYQKRMPMVDRAEALRTFLTEGKMRAAPSLFDPVFLAKLDRRWKAKKETANAL